MLSPYTKIIWVSLYFNTPRTWCSLKPFTPILGVIPVASVPSVINPFTHSWGQIDRRRFLRANQSLFFIVFLVN